MAAANAAAWRQLGENRRNGVMAARRGGMGASAEK